MENKILSEIGQNLIHGTFDIKETWEKVRAEKIEIDSRKKDLTKKEKEDYQAADEKAERKYREEITNAPPVVQELLKMREAIKKNMYSYKTTLLPFAAVLVALILLNVFVLKLTWPGIITYGAIVIISALFAGAVAVGYAMFCKAQIDAINQDSGVIELNEKQAKLKAAANEEKDAIYHEKYEAEWQALRKREEENPYESIRQAMISLTYKNVVLFYFKKIGYGVTYTIEVDGVTVCASKQAGAQAVALNPGYHSVCLRVRYESSEKIEYRNYAFQKEGESGPYFVWCDKVCTYADVVEVSLEEFEKKCGEKLLE